MAGFVIKAAIALNKYVAKPAVKYIARETIRAVPTVLKPAGDFTRGFVKGVPKYVPIAGSQGARQATISASFTAGRQVRYIVGQTGRAAFLSGPRGALVAAKYVVRTTVRDTISPYHYASIGYQVPRALRLNRGATSAAERVLDRILISPNKYLDKVGLATTASGIVGTTIRGAAAGTLFYGIDHARGVVDVVHNKAVHYINRADAYATTLRPDNVPVGTVPVLPPVVANGGVPVGAAPAPIPHHPAGTPALPVPAQQGRTYIPVNRGRR